VVTAPMLYMLRPGVAERITQFVQAGGTFIATYWSGIVNETDLCFLGGFPGPLRPVLGIWSEEIDTLYPTDENWLVLNAGNTLGLTEQYKIHSLCDLIHAESATVLATYGSDFYAGRPALTVNNYGQGRAYYIAARTEQVFLDDFYRALVDDLQVRRVIAAPLPEGVSVTERTDGERRFVFVMNFADSERRVTLDPHPYVDVRTGDSVSGQLVLSAFDTRIFEIA